MITMHKFMMIAAMALLGVANGWAQQPGAGDLNALMGALGQVMQGGTNAASVVDFRELKGLLPTELPGLKRMAASGEKTSAMGMTISFAEGRYVSGDSSIEIKMSDYGGSGLASMMAAGWAMQEVDRETETGFERTTTISGHKAMEKFDGADKGGSTEVLVAGRFLVEVTGNNVTAEAIKAAVEKIDLAKLAALKK
jgi:hypothetical protein